MRKKYAALTFDDGPSADTTPMLLDLIGKYSITASFFCLWAKYQRKYGANNAPRF